MNIKNIEIKKLKPYKNNTKKHSKEQIKQIAKSMEEFGITQPILVDNNLCVVAGHGRVLGAKKAGFSEIPVIFLSDLTEEQIKAYRLIDNKLNESEWDYALLEEELSNIINIDMEIFGFNEKLDIMKSNIQEIKTEEYSYQHFLVTFNRGDKNIEKFREFLDRRNFEYKENHN